MLDVAVFRVHEMNYICLFYRADIAITLKYLLTVVIVDFLWFVLFPDRWSAGSYHYLWIWTRWAGVATFWNFFWWISVKSVNLEDLLLIPSMYGCDCHVFFSWIVFHFVALSDHCSASFRTTYSICCSWCEEVWLHSIQMIYFCEPASFICFFLNVSCYFEGLSCSPVTSVMGIFLICFHIWLNFHDKILDYLPRKKGKSELTNLV